MGAIYYTYNYIICFRIIPAIQESSSSALYGDVIGGVVGVIIIVMIILGIIFFRRKKGNMYTPVIGGAATINTLCPLSQFSEILCFFNAILPM